MAPDRRMIPSCSIVGTAGAAGGGGGGGGGAPTITLTNTSVEMVAAGTALAGYRVNADGTVDALQQAQGHALIATFFQNWISDPAQAVNYEVKAVLASGSPPNAGALGSYLALTSDRAWTLTNGASDNSVLSSVLTVTIRKTGTTTVLATATITLSAESDA